MTVIITTKTIIALKLVDIIKIKKCLHQTNKTKFLVHSSLQCHPPTECQVIVANHTHTCTIQSRSIPFQCYWLRYHNTHPYMQPLPPTLRVYNPTTIVNNTTPTLSNTFIHQLNYFLPLLVNFTIDVLNLNNGASEKRCRKLIQYYTSAKQGNPTYQATIALNSTTASSTLPPPPPPPPQ